MWKTITEECRSKKGFWRSGVECVSSSYSHTDQSYAHVVYAAGTIRARNRKAVRTCSAADRRRRPGPFLPSLFLLPVRFTFTSADRSQADSNRQHATSPARTTQGNQLIPSPWFWLQPINQQPNDRTSGFPAETDDWRSVGSASAHPHALDYHSVTSSARGQPLARVRLNSELDE